MARDGDSSAWRMSARAFGVVRVAVALRVVGLVGAVVELWSAEGNQGLRITAVAATAMVLSDVVAAAGAARLALRAPAGRRAAGIAAAALVAGAAFDTWALAWLTDAVSTAGPLVIHGMDLCALTAALGILVAATAAARAIRRVDLLPGIHGAISLVVVGAAIVELGISLHDDAGLLLMFPAFVVLVIAGIAYVRALGRVRAAILDHAPPPPHAQALVQ